MVLEFVIGLKWLRENIEKLKNVEQMEKMIPLIMAQVAFRQQVCELVFGVNIFDLDIWGPIDSVKQPIQARICAFGTRVPSSDVDL